MDCHVVQSVLTTGLHTDLSMASFVHVIMTPAYAFVHCLNLTSFLESVLQFELFGGRLVRHLAL